MVPDSACTATALFTGVKTNFETTGVDSRVKLNDCITSLDKSTHLKSLLEYAIEVGMSTGKYVYIVQ